MACANALVWQEMFNQCGLMSTQIATPLTDPLDGGSGSKQSLEMSRKRLLEAVLPQDTASQRQKLGTLRDLTVQPATKRRYKLATEAFFTFLKAPDIALPRRKDAMDPFHSFVITLNIFGVQEPVVRKPMTPWQVFRISTQGFETIDLVRGAFCALVD